MDKTSALNALLDRAFAARIPLHDLCAQAGVAYSTVSRWRKRPDAMTVRPLAKLEAALDTVERQRKGGGND